VCVFAHACAYQAVGTVTGIINGSGSVTAAFGQMAIPVLADWGATDGVGYRYVWLFLVACTLAGTPARHAALWLQFFQGNLSTNICYLLASNAPKGPLLNFISSLELCP